MKIVHVIHSLAVGGLENGVVNLVNSAQHRLRHTIVCTTTDDGPLRARLAADIDVFSLHKRKGQDPCMVLRLGGLLRRMRPDVVHSRNWGTFDAVLAARLARVPIVIHGEHGREASDPLGRSRRRNFLRRLLSPLINRFVAVSEDLRRWLVEDVRIAPGKVMTLYNGVDVERFAPQDRERARAMVVLRPEQVVIGTVGRLDPVKDQTGLIRAFAALGREHTNRILLIVGEGPCRRDLQQLVASLQLEDRVRLLGTREDVDALLRAFDVFVLSSVAEGTSNTILEAMATGLPIVATAVGGNPELVLDGENGLLVRPSDPRALSSALDAYVSNPQLRSAHGKSSRRIALEKFSLQRMRAAYAGLYAELASQRVSR